VIRRALLVAAFATACSPGERNIPAAVEIGRPVPSYRSASITGDSVSLADQRGKVVLLNVWATWCHPCREEIPELRAVHQRFGARGLELIGVSVDASGNEDGIRQFMKEFDMSYPVWHDPDERISTQFLVIGVPATFLIDRDGVLRWRKTGPVQPGDTSLTNAIERALGG
jgi:cytochrome c biogenesis protein CcmG, thiol:disulfide interchange protein DsbE